MSEGRANKFGFAISRSRLIDYDATDRKVREYVTLREPSFRLCFACGGCTATCTAGQHTSFNLRRMNTYIRRFPQNLLAGMFGFTPRPYFESMEGAEKAPEVTF